MESVQIELTVSQEDYNFLKALNGYMTSIELPVSLDNKKVEKDTGIIEHIVTLSESKGIEERKKWNTEELKQDFEVIGFSAPFVVVKRKSDGIKGSLEFTHMPRKYFNWTEDK